MDDLTTSPPASLVVSRGCEASRLQGQLLARAYQCVYPEVRRPLADRPIPAPAARRPEGPSTAARLAAGA
jgi:hypothetical protein